MSDTFTRIGRYELLAPIGRGRAFEVFKARSFGVEGFEKKVVVKRVRPEAAQDEPFVKVFVDEANRAMRLSHANVAQVFDVGHEDDDDVPRYFLATELVMGFDLGTLIGRLAFGSAPIGLATYIAGEVAMALDYAHRRRDDALNPAPIVHGSVAPSQVLLSWEGNVKLSDFGMSRALLVASEGATGPLDSLYAVLSKEQARGQVATPLCDVYGLGLLIHTVLTGKNPFLGADARETLSWVTRGGAPALPRLRADVPPSLGDLVTRAMSVDHQARPPDVATFYEELKAITLKEGFKFGPGDLAKLVQDHRQPRQSESDDIDSLLARPVSVSPPASAPPPSTRPSLPPLAAFGEMRHVAVLVTRLPEGLPEALRVRARAALVSHGADSVEFASDGLDLRATFGLGVSSGSEVVTAALAGHVVNRLILARDSRVATGIAAGRVRPDQDGDPGLEGLVDEARRLAYAAEARVLVSTSAVAYLRSRFEVSRFGDAFVVERLARPQGGWDRFVGRKQELVVLAEELAASAQGACRLVRVVGDQGIGKTRLIEEMRRRLARGRTTIATYTVSCPVRGLEAPYSGLLAMLRRLAGVAEGDPPERVEAVAQRLRALGLTRGQIDAVTDGLDMGRLPRGARIGPELPNAFAQILKALVSERFHVFVWDDAQNLDAATAMEIQGLRAELETSRLAMLLAGRPSDSAPYHDVEVDREVQIAEMTEADLVRQLAVRLDVDEPPSLLVEYVRQRAGGHPMFVDELVRGAFEAGALVRTDGAAEFDPERMTVVPKTLAALVAGRLQRLPTEARDVAVAATILGTPARAEVIARMLELSVSEVDGAVATLQTLAFVDRGVDSTIEFNSALVPEAILAELDDASERELHEHAAKAYQQAYPDRLEEEAARIGYHLAVAGFRDAAADFYATSALHHLGQKRFDYGVAELVYALDLAELELRGGPQIGNWVRALSSAVRHVRTGPDLASFVARFRERLDQRGDFERRIRVQLAIDLALVLGALHHYGDAEALLDDSAKDVEEWPQAVRALLAARGEMAIEMGQIVLASGFLARASELRPGDAVEQHRIALATALAYSASGDADSAARTMAQAASLVASQDRVLGAERHRVLAQVAYDVGNYSEAARLARGAAVDASEAGLAYEHAAALLVEGRARLHLGERARAFVQVTEAQSVADGLGLPRLTAQCRMLLTCIESENVDDGLRSIDELRESARANGWVADVLLAHLVSIWLCDRFEQPAAALRHDAEASSLASSTGNVAFARVLARERERRA
jgi:eukaryotic-like serine/threonine-protein kinase